MSGKVLIVDDVATNRIVMKVKLASAGYVPCVVNDGAACLDAIHADMPDLVLLDLHLPDMHGTHVLRHLRANPATRHLPVIVFSAVNSHSARLAAFEAGADDYLEKPLDDQTMLARIRNLIRARDEFAGLSHGTAALPGFELAETAAAFEGPALIALVAERPESSLHLRHQLAPLCGHRFLCLSPSEALSVNVKDAVKPDLFVIESDIKIHGGGLRLMSDLRSRSDSRDAAFVIWQNLDSPALPAIAYDLGAHDLMHQGLEKTEVALRIARLIRLKREEDKLRLSIRDGLRLAVIDPLTGLYNRRYGLNYLQSVAERTHQEGSSFAVLVADIDRFKRINDQYGHAAGDAVLVEVATRLCASLRTGDMVARIGGEEFLIVLPDTSLEVAHDIAERLCLSTMEKPFPISAMHKVICTLSIGLATSGGLFAPISQDAIVEIIDRADQALLRSKAAGRNQVTISKTAA
jgi:two-component system, cell cycle response regulator